MKKISIAIIAFLSSFLQLYAQKVEIAYAFPFSDEIPFYEDYDPNEGWPGGISVRVVEEGSFYIQDSSSGDFFICRKNQSPVRYISDHAFIDLKGSRLSFSENHLFYTRTSERLNYSFTGIINSIPVSFTEQVNIDPDNYHVYLTGNILFIESSHSHDMESLEFLPDGSYKVRDASETKAWLEDGKGEELGWGELILNNKVYGHTFGEIILGLSSESYKFTVQNHLKPMSDKYVDITNMNQTEYVLFGKDSKGLMYYRDFPSGNDNVNIEFAIAVLDPFTQEVYFYEDYGTCLWTPPTDKAGKIIGSYSWTVAPDGNIYFTDADVEKGEYQIKRVTNRWWDEMGINDRIIGQMNTNHVPLLTKMKGKENDGYCFENDFVWVTEQSKDKKWSKIKKIDGREGWVETKYIDINTMVPVTNASLGITLDQSSSSTSKSAAATPAAKTASAKILKAADNLRLRKTELTSSEVVTTMLKGTAVKVIATGRQDTIDGITANWVQVEIQSGGKDRNGNAIPAGTTGWCFGGYLE